MTQKWVFGGTTMDYNPSSDTLWTSDVVTGKQHPPTATFTIVQQGGLQSPARELKGITKSKTIRDALEALKNSVFSATDLFGATNNVWIESLTWDIKQDLSNPPLFVYWEYVMRLIQR